MSKIWFCKIGETDDGNVPYGADFPMRRTIEAAYTEITGESPEFIFSGWGGELTESERLVAYGLDLPKAEPAVEVER